MTHKELLATIERLAKENHVPSISRDTRQDALLALLEHGEAGAVKVLLRARNDGITALYHRPMELAVADTLERYRAETAEALETGLRWQDCREKLQGIELPPKAREYLAKIQDGETVPLWARTWVKYLIRKHLRLSVPLSLTSDRVNERLRLRYAANPTPRQIRNKRYKKAHRDELSVKNKAYYSEHRDDILQRVNENSKKNYALGKEYCAELNIYNSKVFRKVGRRVARGEKPTREEILQKSC